VVTAPVTGTLPSGTGTQPSGTGVQVQSKEASDVNVAIAEKNQLQQQLDAAKQQLANLRSEQEQEKVNAANQVNALQVEIEKLKSRDPQEIDPQIQSFIDSLHEDLKAAREGVNKLMEQQKLSEEQHKKSIAEKTQEVKEANQRLEESEKKAEERKSKTEEFVAEIVEEPSWFGKLLGYKPTIKKMGDVTLADLEGFLAAQRGQAVETEEEEGTSTPIGQFEKVMTRAKQAQGN